MWAPRRMSVRLPDGSEALLPVLLQMPEICHGMASWRGKATRCPLLADTHLFVQGRMQPWLCEKHADLWRGAVAQYHELQIVNGCDVVVMAHTLLRSRSPHVVAHASSLFERVQRCLEARRAVQGTFFSDVESDDGHVRFLGELQDVLATYRSLLRDYRPPLQDIVDTSDPDCTTQEGADSNPTPSPPDPSDPLRTEMSDEGSCTSRRSDLLQSNVERHDASSVKSNEPATPHVAAQKARRKQKLDKASAWLEREICDVQFRLENFDIFVCSSLDTIIFGSVRDMEAAVQRLSMQHLRSELQSLMAIATLRDHKLRIQVLLARLEHSRGTMENLMAAAVVSLRIWFNIYSRPLLTLHMPSEREVCVTMYPTISNMMALPRPKSYHAGAFECANACTATRERWVGTESGARIKLTVVQHYTNSCVTICGRTAAAMRSLDENTHHDAYNPSALSPYMCMYMEYLRTIMHYTQLSTLFDARFVFKTERMMRLQPVSAPLSSMCSLMLQRSLQHESSRWMPTVHELSQLTFELSRMNVGVHSCDSLVEGYELMRNLAVQVLQAPASPPVFFSMVHAEATVRRVGADVLRTERSDETSWQSRRSELLQGDVEPGDDQVCLRMERGDLVVCLREFSCDSRAWLSAQARALRAHFLGDEDGVRRERERCLALQDKYPFPLDVDVPRCASIGALTRATRARLTELMIAASVLSSAIVNDGIPTFVVGSDVCWCAHDEDARQIMVAAAILDSRRRGECHKLMMREYEGYDPKLSLLVRCGRLRLRAAV